MIGTELHQLLKNLPNKLIATVHKDPDFDAIGSLLALGSLIQSLNKEITLFSPDINLKQFDFLPGIKTITSTTELTYDVAFFLDCSDQNRIFNPKRFPKAETIVNIDHHQDNTFFGKINVVQNISSVGEMMFNIYNELNIEITTDIASNLYAAIAFDTGNFKFSNTTPETFMVASKLLKKEINAAKISELIFERKSKEFFADIKQGLNNMYIDKQYPFIIVHIPFHEQLSNESTINFFRQLENIELVIVCKEVKESEYRISFRSKQFIDVSKLAKNFNGGGHIKASGATVSSSFNELNEQLLKETHKAFQ